MFAAFILLPTRFWPRIDRELPFLAIALVYTLVPGMYEKKRKIVKPLVCENLQITNELPRTFSSFFLTMCSFSFVCTNKVERLQLPRDTVRPASSTPSFLALGGPLRCACGKRRARRRPFHHSAKPYFSPPSDNI